MGSTEIIPFLDLITDFAGAAGDLFGALSFFAGSADSFTELLG